MPEPGLRRWDGDLGPGVRVQAAPGRNRKLEVNTKYSLVVATSLGLQVLVERLLSTGFGSLNVPVFLLETLGTTLQSQCLFDKVLLAVLLGDTVAEEFSGALNDGSHLRVLRGVGLAVVLLVVSMRIKHRTHADELKISLELCGHFSLGKIEPCRSGIGFFLTGVVRQ